MKCCFRSGRNQDSCLGSENPVPWNYSSHKSISIMSPVLYFPDFCKRRKHLQENHSVGVSIKDDVLKSLSNLGSGDLWRSSAPTFCSKQDQIQNQSRLFKVILSSWVLNIRWRRLHSIPGHPVPHSEKMFPHTYLKFPMFSLCLSALVTLCEPLGGVWFHLCCNNTQCTRQLRQQ